MQVDVNNQLPTLTMTTSLIFGTYESPITHMHHQSLHKNSSAKLSEVCHHSTNNNIEKVGGLRDDTCTKTKTTRHACVKCRPITNNH